MQKRNRQHGFTIVELIVTVSILGLMLFLVTDMFILELVMSLSGVPFFLAILAIPESPRWLLINGREEEGRAKGAIEVYFKVLVLIFQFQVWKLSRDFAR